MNSNPFWKLALRYGLIYGVSSVLILLCFYALGVDQSGWQQALGIVLMVIILVMAMREYKMEALGGYLTVGQGFKLGLMVCLIGQLISGAYFSFIHIPYVDPDMINRILEQARIKLEDKGMSDEQIEHAISMQSKFMTPGYMFVFALLSVAIVGSLISLIIAAIMKKNNDSFEAFTQQEETI